MSYDVAMKLETALDLRHRHESTAYVILHVCAIPFWVFVAVRSYKDYGVALVMLFVYWATLRLINVLFLAYIRTNAVRISERQIPKLHRLVRESADRLGLTQVPEVYLIQDGAWNAFAAKAAGDRIVVLHSGAVDSIMLKGDMQQLSWVLGHELGHHALGHLDWGHRMASLGFWAVPVYLWHSRLRELSCDRVGLYCSGSANASLAAMKNMLVGAQMSGNVDPGETSAQWRSQRGRLLVQILVLISSYPPSLRRLDAMRESVIELGIPE